MRREAGRTPRPDPHIIDQPLQHTLVLKGRRHILRGSNAATPFQVASIECIDARARLFEVSTRLDPVNALYASESCSVNADRSFSRPRHSSAGAHRSVMFFVRLSLSLLDVEAPVVTFQCAGET
jgi:hypothetical protein